VVATGVASIIGLTGGIASGKSTVAAMLRDRGAAVVDADQLAREIVLPGQPALAELVARFGADIVRADGTLDRPALAAKAFADPEARRDLDRITHPRIAAAAAAAIAAAARAGAPVVFYEAALLVENGLHRGLAGTIVVAVSPEVQAARLARRDGLTDEQIAARLAAQLPLADKLAAATWVVDNRGDRAALTAEVDALWHRLEDRFGPLVAAPRGEHVLVTGAPDPLALELCRELRRTAPSAELTVLVGAAAAEATAATLAPLGHVAIVTGDVAAMDLGLATAEYRALLAAVTTIHHVAPACPQPSGLLPYRTAVVEGTRGVLELAAEAPRLRRLIHWSPVDVVGGTIGRVAEAPLPAPPITTTGEARAAYQAEALAVAAMARLPITIVRVGHIVDGPIGERRTALALFRLVARRAAALQLPLPGDGAGPLHIVRADFAIAAAALLGAEPAGRGPGLPPGRSRAAVGARRPRSRRGAGRTAAAARGAAAIADPGHPAHARARSGGDPADRALGPGGVARPPRHRRDLRAPRRRRPALPAVLHLDRSGARAAGDPPAPGPPRRHSRSAGVTEGAAPRPHSSSPPADLARRPARSRTRYRNLRSRPASRAAWLRLPPARSTRSVR
jgi:dephospho-CoA kinase